MTPSQTAHPTEGERGREHDLKTWPTPFADVKAGRKPFEFRFNDRDFREGDTLRLREWSPDTADYTGDSLLRGVGYILHGGQFGIPDGYVILALSDARPQGEEGLREAEKAATEANRDLRSALWQTLYPKFFLNKKALAEALDVMLPVFNAYATAQAVHAVFGRSALSNQGKPSS